MSAGRLTSRSRNFGLDLRTGTLLPHSPDVLTSFQLPWDWDPGASCPTYDWWVEQVIPEQIDDLEESASPLLDPTRTPVKSLLLYGPTRSGKSTFLRLLETLVGEDNCSAVSLHQLGSDRCLDVLISIPVTIVASSQGEVDAKIERRLPEGAFVVVQPVVPIPDEVGVVLGAMGEVLGAGPVYQVRDHLTPKGRPSKRGTPRPRLPRQPKLQVVTD